MTEVWLGEEAAMTDWLGEEAAMTCEGWYIS